MEQRGTLRIGPALVDFVEREALVDLDLSAESLWRGLEELVDRFTSRNRELLEVRGRMQAEIDEWHREHPGPVIDVDSYRQMLHCIGYLADEGDPFQVRTSGTDSDLSTTAGPQLVVPVTNARFALNAANARWGSLYDALYGTDALGSSPTGGGYDEVRGSEVVRYVRSFLDDVAPLEAGSHGEATKYLVHEQQLWVETSLGTVGLQQPEKFVGFIGEPSTPGSVILENHGLRVIIQFDADGPIGKTDAATIDDVALESAVTAIVDFEDSVATVDAEDKATAYRHWLGLMNRTLAAEVEKSGEVFTRRLNDPITFTAATGEPAELRAQATLLVRNVGHLTTTPAVLDADGNEVFEGLLDAMFTVLCALHDLRGPRANSPEGSIYIVKPKMHGPDEVAFTCEVFDFVEQVLGLEPNTVKIGIMDEERRTTLNLRECLRAAADRVVFINTGFLDRTGDEIHTSFRSGPFVPKSEMKQQRWIRAYEDWNVDVGLSCGLRGRGQIGKGMWAAPNAMEVMLAAKRAHPEAGASCAWVPSPTAATLHAIHYHQVNVAAQQQRIQQAGLRASLDDLLELAVASEPSWDEATVQNELDNNVQGILGYVVRWIDQGVGCSTVPDIEGVGLMEDRATCRISSQHVANWLHHGVVTEQQVEDTLRKMAAVVDEQNAADPLYDPMAPSFAGHAFLAARELVFEGATQPNGYTELILHRRRRLAKADAKSVPTGIGAAGSGASEDAPWGFHHQG